MKPESRRALMELISFGMEEISSEDAAPLLARIEECSECAGQWVLFHRTIDTLSQVGETDVSSQRAQQMWLVCMEHAGTKKHTLADYDGHAHPESKSEATGKHNHTSDGHAAGSESAAPHLEKLRSS